MKVKKKPGKSKRSKCFCEVVEPNYCGDCDRPFFSLTLDEVEDVLSALSFFQTNYPDKKGSVHTRRAMRVMTKRLFEMKRNLR